MQSSSNSSWVVIRRLLTLVAIVGIIAGVWFERYAIYDIYRLHDYNAPVPVSALATSDTMTKKAQNLFYVNHPQLLDRTSFGNHCPEDEQTIVLGCYVPRDGIYLFDVTDERLHGVEEVTAAHEMLHAAYERLDSNTREHIDTLTQQAYANLVDQRVRDNIEAYRRSDPSVVPNELHSILGTEVSSLPAELEQYYSQYFTNRAVVVAFSNNYEKEFTDRRATLDEDNNKLKDMKTRIDAAESELSSLKAQLLAQRQSMEDLSRAGNYEAFNAQVGPFNAGVDSYNAKAAALKIQIDAYNALVDQVKALQLEVNNLRQSLDSRQAQDFSAQ